MKKLVLSMVIAMSAINVMAQTEKEEGYLFADESRIVDMDKSEHVKVVTANQDIANQLISWYKPCMCISYRVTVKKDRNGKYYEYSITLPAEKKAEIIHSYADVPKRKS